MLFKVIAMFVLVGGAYYLYNKYIGPGANFRKCKKCDGYGYWRGTRGEKEKCDECNGEGKIWRG